jgi:hypothetical protein
MEFLVYFFTASMWNFGIFDWMRVCGEISKDCSTLVAAIVLSGLLIGKVQAMIKVSGSEKIGSLLVFNLAGVKDTATEQDLEAKFKDYRASYKIRRFRKKFLFKIFWWWFCSVLYITTWLGFLTVKNDIIADMNVNLVCGIYYMFKLIKHQYLGHEKFQKIGRDLVMFDSF